MYILLCLVMYPGWPLPNGGSNLCMGKQLFGSSIAEHHCSMALLPDPRLSILMSSNLL